MLITFLCILIFLRLLIHENPFEKLVFVNIIPSGITHLVICGYCLKRRCKCYMNFRQYTNVTEIIIPEKVKVINSINMCSHMQNLKYVNIMSNQIFSLQNSFNNCRQLEISEGCGPNVTNMYGAYQNCYNLTTAVCGPNVTNMSWAYYNCYNLTTAVCGPNVMDMYYAYASCRNLTTAVCGPNVTSMSNAYKNCQNLTTAVCGPNVTNMSWAYYNCTNLTTAVCGPNVTDMSWAYVDCTNLTTAVCGPNVTDMSSAYYGCTNLTTAVCGPNVTDMSGAYRNCCSIYGDLYLHSNNINSFTSCFNGRNTSNRLNIYVPSGSTTNTKVMITYTSSSITGTVITFTNDFATNGCYYNTLQNIYIYPVANVEAARIANED
jgi:hypothetical protein